MKYKILGKSGLRVSELCLGTMTFGKDWAEFLRGSTKEDSKEIFDMFVEAGGNFIDTANNYQNGTSERYVGEFIRTEREKFVLATKYTLSTNANDPNASGSHRKNLLQSVNASLKRLHTEYIDLLWVHAWDFMTPLEELMRSLDDLIKSGKILYIGISDAPAWVVARANTMADMHSWTPFIGMQIMYSLVERTPERELLPMAHDLDIGVTAWSPLGGGVLSGKYGEQISEEGKEQEKRFDPKNPMMEIFVNQKTLLIAKEVRGIAMETGRTPSQIALSWLRYRKDRGSIITILGARTPEQMKDNLGSLEVELSPDQLRRLDEISKIELGFPHDFLSSEMVKSLIYGNKYSRIDYHRTRVS